MAGRSKLRSAELVGGRGILAGAIAWTLVEAVVNGGGGIWILVGCGRGMGLAPLGWSGARSGRFLQF